MDAYTQWRNLIGSFILEFSHVEVEVYGIFEDFASDEELVKAKTLPFKRRVTEAIQLIEREFPDQDSSRSAKRALNELIKLGEGVRNLIAHNPVELSLESVFTDVDEYEIRSYRSSATVITYSDLEAKFHELEKWRDQLFFNTSRMRHMLAWRRNKGN